MALPYKKPKDIIKSEDWNYMADVSNGIPIDKTSERSLNTVYQNTTGHKLLVSVIISITSQESDADDWASTETFAYISADDTPNTIVSHFRIAQKTDYRDIDACVVNYVRGVFTHNFIVSDGYYYKIEGGTIIKWYEQYIW